MNSKFVGNTQLIMGGEESLPRAVAFMQESGIVAEGSPDLYLRAYARFGIDEARELRERAALKPVAGERRVFIIATPTLTSEAQNALLKTLEESGALFMLITPSPHALLPALRSRAQFLSLGFAGDTDDAKAFLRASKAERLELLKPLLEKDEDGRDLRPVLSLLTSLEAVLGARAGESDAREGLNALYRARKYLADKGALAKPLLEQVALLAPVVR